MRQFLRKSAIVALLSAVALCGTARQATAQVAVTPNGVGDLLVFAYWTAYERDTLIAITNAFGGDARRYVHIRIHEGINSADVGDFTICLSPGDVWTAAITSNGRNASDSTLVIGNAGTCDNTVASGQGLTPPPAQGGPGVPINADFGYIEAYTVECNSPALAPGCPAAPTAPWGNSNGGDDTIMGTATLVSASAGFSSSYNATSLSGFNAFNESATMRNTSGDGTIGGQGARPLLDAALANEGGVNKQVLMGRWTASTLFNSSTDVVLTFPTGTRPQGANILGQPFPDPVSAWVFDEEENFIFSPRSMWITYEVNICRFINADESSSTNTQFICNNNPVGSIRGTGDVLGPGGTFSGGWFRILNNNDLVPGAVDGIGDGSGAESDNIDAVPDSAFPVIGLVFSFFQGGTNIFDQAYRIQWAAITGQGGIGGPLCGITNAPSFPGCRAFNIGGDGSFSPHQLPGNGPVTPANDHTTGNLNRRSDSN